MKVAVVYWSGTGNTEAMAQAMVQGAESVGAETVIFTTDQFAASNVVNFDGVLFGCPAMGNEVLEEAEFEPMFAGLETELSGVPVGLFGSYGWGSGEWMEDWQTRCREDGANVYENGLIIQNTPDQDGLEKCRSFAAGFVEANKG